MPVIRLEGLTKRYGPVPVLHGIDLAMADKEFTVLVGPSGCGKSTTLRIIAGLEEVSSGRIVIGEREVTHLEPKDRDIAMVFQDYALYPHMDVARNMSFALRLAGCSRAKIEGRVRPVAEMLGISPLLPRKPRELSGGQRQRVAMGRALVRDSSVFLFDEPLSNLDAKLRGQMRAELALMRQRLEKNMIYVTHDQIEAMTLGDRIVVMHAGRIQQQGTPEELYKRPANRFVAGFIGSPPMNFLAGEIGEEAGSLFVAGKGYRLPLAPSRAGKIRACGTRDVVLGLRPSAILPRAANANGARLDLDILVSEYVGAHSVLVADCGGTRVTVEVNSETPVTGHGSQAFGVDPQAIHLFDPSTDQAI
jgi:multiple sugar transport system ATP-binding protein